MSDQDDIFNLTDPKETETNPAETTPVSQPDPFTDILMGIKNENGEPKYKTVEDALKALGHSQQFIKTLQQEKAELKSQFEQASNELEKMGNIESFVNRISPNTQTPAPNPTGKEAATLSETEITKLLENALEQREKQSQEKNNYDMVVGEITKVHGDKASVIIAQRAKELNTTTETLRELAKSNPAMALSLLSVAGTQPVQPVKSTINATIKPSDSTEAPKFERSAARGGLSNKDLADRWRQVRDFTYKQLNVES